MMVWPRLAEASTASSKLFLRSSIDIEKNSPCLPAMNRPSIFRSSSQWRIFCRKPSSSTARELVKGVSAAAQMPFIWARA
ncbi:hypothetical protein BTHI11S_03029 [Bosea thiooxidans]